MKKLLALSLTLALVLGLAPAGAAAAPGLTRAQLAAAVAARLRPESAAGSHTFSDVAEDHPQAAAIAALAAGGLISGDGDGSFRPDAAVTGQEAAAVLLRYMGLADSQLAPWPQGYVDLAQAMGLALKLDETLDQSELEALLTTADAHRAGLSAETPAPLFVNGVALPVFPYDTVVREVVYVETNHDTDGDGKADLVQVLVQRPAATDRGMKAAAIYEARPYSAGTTDTYGADTWNAHVVNAELTQATESTTAAREDFKPAPASADAPQRRASAPLGRAGDGGDVWERTENVDAYDYWLVRGYAYVSCSGLGTLGSEGFETCGSYEEIDAFAQVVRWLSGEEGVRAYADPRGETQVLADWCNGNVAMSGQSYAGTTAFAVAATGVEGLKTIVPRAGIASWYDYYRSQGTAAGGLFYPGDDCDILADYCMSRRLNEGDYAGIRADYEAYLVQMIEEQDRLGGDYNAFWYERDYTNSAGNLEASALIIHGLNDFNVRPKQFDMMYDAFRSAGQTAKLVLHQGAHSTPEQIDGLDLNGILGRWYAHYLYGVENGAEAEAAVRVQSNTDLSWRTYDSWGEAGKTLTLTAGDGEGTFSSDLSLTSFDTGLADVDEGWIEYCTDMAYAWEREMLAGDTGASAVYRFDAAEDVHIKGTVQVEVKAAADRATGILSAMLVDFAPDGGMEAVMLEEYGEGVATHTVGENALWYGGGLPYRDLTQYDTVTADAKVITRGWMDIQNRTSSYQVDTVTPGEFYTFTLELQPMDYVVKAGHQLGLVLYSTDPVVTYWPQAVTTFTVDESATVVTIPVA